MQLLTISAAWLIIAEAFMRRAAGEKQFSVQGVSLPQIATSGFCNAIGDLEDAGVLHHSDANEMYGTVDDAPLDLDDLYSSGRDWPARKPRNRLFRATFALLQYEEALARETAPVGTGL